MTNSAPLTRQAAIRRSMKLNPAFRTAYISMLARDKFLARYEDKSWLHRRFAGAAVLRHELREITRDLSRTRRRDGTLQTARAMIRAPFEVLREITRNP